MRAQLIVAALVACIAMHTSPEPSRAAEPTPALGPARPIVVTTGARTRTVVEARYTSGHAFTVARPSPTAPPDLTSPESAAREAVRAMARGDFEAWLALWEPPARARFEARLTEPGQGRADWIQRWADGIGPGLQRLTTRYEVGAFVVIVYRPDKYPAALGGGLPIVVRRQPSGEWKLTQGLARSGLVHELLALAGGPAVVPPAGALPGGGLAP
ncbi:MAG: hypothetical protein IT385_16605 [Deltaproteobacteria bacterium]|nr:hypothetical protein [Deltaproteobacteria bacterium]